MNNVYEKNSTMLLLGKQQYSSIVSKKAAQRIKDICMAREGEITENAALDAYVMGFLDGRNKKMGNINAGTV